MPVLLIAEANLAEETRAEIANKTMPLIRPCPGACSHRAAI